MAGVHPQGHLGLFAIATERPLANKQADKEAAVEVI
jgi:hypothetical protein